MSEDDIGDTDYDVVMMMNGSNNKDYEIIIIIIMNIIRMITIVM